VRDPHDIQALFIERLAALGDEVDPGFGFDLVRLSVSLAEACPDEQIGLNGGDDGEIDRLVDRLSARLGRRRVTRLIAQDSHIPELAALAAPAQATATAESGWPAFRRFRDDADLAPRPLRLLAKPEPIDDVVSSVPDGPPARFRWRRALHEIVAAEGPERIEGVWWNEAGRPVRDYYRVEDATGLRFWVFREKLYDLRPRNAPRERAEAERHKTGTAAATSPLEALTILPWFIHGTYA
jgi:protein ImuB